MSFLTVSAIVPPATVLPYAATAAPDGWLLCDGSAVSRTTYASLFAVIGTSHGSGDGSTTFNLPDYRGRFLRGVDGSASVDPDKASRTAMATGGATGNNVGSVQSDSIASHSHGVWCDSAETGSGQVGLGGGGTDFTYSTNAFGGAETRPKNAYVNYIVKF